jgi:hypothetical protein
MQSNEVDLHEDYTFRREALLYNLYHDVRCIAGNFPFSTEAYMRFSGTYRFITTLLDPIDFMVWAYTNRHMKRLPCAQGSLEDFLEHDFAKQVGSMYVHFYCGQFLNSLEIERRHIEDAKRNLAKFNLVGDLCEPSKFYGLLMSMIRPSLIEYFIRRMLDSQCPIAQNLDQMTRKKIGLVSEVNIELHEYACLHLANRLNHTS